MVRERGGEGQRNRWEQKGKGNDKMSPERGRRLDLSDRAPLVHPSCRSSALRCSGRSSLHSVLLSLRVTG